jgi:DNA polymerase I-like protein with 3'-5' exonuclease and polymerase domains
MIFPNLDAVKYIGLDIETKDPDVKELGPGPRRRGNNILGVGISCEGNSWYFPINHIDNENNIPKEKVMSFLNSLKDKSVIGANLSYDMDFLYYEGVKFNGPLIDIQIAEPLLNENRLSYSLDKLGEIYLQRKKYKNEIQEFCDKNKLSGDPRKHLYLMRSNLVGTYCREDCELAEAIFKKQYPRLKDENLIDVFNIETNLIPLLLKMRQTGVRIDLQKLEELRPRYEAVERRLQAKLNKIAGFDLNVKSSQHIDRLFERMGYQRNKTKKGNPSYNKNYLENHGSPEVDLILKLRKTRTMLSNFITGLPRFIVNGRIHCLFHQLRSDEYGTVSGRFSSSNPNLQQQPSKSPHKEDIRGLFLPEEGYGWASLDYSQIEFRGFAHYARGTGAEQMRQTYINNPTMDYHLLCAAMIHNVAPEEITKEQRKLSKSINFGIMYGMGVEKLARELGILSELTPPNKPTNSTYDDYINWVETTRLNTKYSKYWQQMDEARAVLDKYHAVFPFLKETFKDAMNIAQNRGYIKTILGRRRRFTGNYYKALNSVVQGTAADVMKKAMIDAEQAGLFNILIPHLTVHDEIDVSFPKTKEGLEALQELKYIFENTIKFQVPLVVDVETGENWGNLKKFKF